MEVNSGCKDVQLQFTTLNVTFDPQRCHASHYGENQATYVQSDWCEGGVRATLLENQATCVQPEDGDASLGSRCYRASLSMKAGVRAEYMPHC